MRKFSALVVALGSVVLMNMAWAQAPSPGFGVPLTDAEIRPLSITVFPDGRNLPEGRGSVVQGQMLFRNQCAMCHGAKGIEGPAARLAGSDGFISLYDPLRFIRIRKHPLLLLSVGAQWPYATSIFDYVRRAMPHYAPKSLKDDDVYALTAYILHMNKLIPSDAVLDRDSLPAVVMPGLSRTVSAWPENGR
jgi:S-disulfanyl-L-cysteine oxidoreductase SoxD